MNEVVLIGRLTRDPELTYGAENQTAVCRSTLAIDKPVKAQKAGNMADFPRVVVFGRQAENCDRYLAKGREVAVVGRLATDSYTANDGSTKYSTYVVARAVKFLGGGRREENETPQFEAIDEKPPF